MKSLCFTGHRPNRLTGIYDITDKRYTILIDTITNISEEYIKNGIDTFYTGCADGTDILAFYTIHKLKSKYPNIKNKICVPFKNHTINGLNLKWYKMMYKLADEIIYVDQIYKSDNIYQALDFRNHYMVDNSDYIIAVWDGVKNGGTYNCIKYAKLKNKMINYIYIGGNMEIHKINNTLKDSDISFINEIIKNKNNEQINDILDIIKNYIDTQDTLTVKFNDNNPLEVILKNKTIDKITDNSVSFKDDEFDIIINLK